MFIINKFLGFSFIFEINILSLFLIRKNMICTLFEYRRIYNLSVQEFAPPKCSQGKGFLALAHGAKT